MDTQALASLGRDVGGVAQVLQDVPHICLGVGGHLREGAVDVLGDLPDELALLRLRQVAHILLEIT